MEIERELNNRNKQGATPAKEIIMKVSINGYEVEIKAKGVYGTKYNDIDTKEFLLELSHVLSLAQDTALNVGLSDTHDNIVKSVDNIHDVLLKNGMDYHRL